MLYLREGSPSQWHVQNEYTECRVESVCIHVRVESVCINVGVDSILSHHTV